MSRALVSSTLRRGLSAAAAPRMTSRAAFSATARAADQILPVRVHGEGSGTQQSLSVPDKPYTFSSDTYTALGGGDSAPSPVVYSLASLGSCNQVTGSIVGRDHGVRLGRWKVDVEGALPTAVLVQGAPEGNPNWESVVLKVAVQTDIDGGSDSPKFQHFVSEVERRCPITALFRLSGVKLTSEWVNEPLP
ncbi:OsmC family protein [Sporothrix brasiliensis 5110]|uniref:OsmC family protein n=1 Tax=Sporothrix brasiliensis 5110 TaxID=1398154 RepID=A0A0C2J699_9PEZI|nr:OsmC family protein [Sporothrix brasiliensis 5110]KIH94505.1 OsmC family protein [Sporothrix brasiliensis 5110]